MNESRRYQFQKHHAGVFESGMAHAANWTEAELIDELVKQLVDARRMAMTALAVHAERRDASANAAPKAIGMGHGVSGVMASAIGDVVKVPPHWHVRLRAARDDGSTALLIGDEVSIPINDARAVIGAVTKIVWGIRGFVEFDVITHYPVHLSDEAQFLTRRPGISATATVIAVH